MKIAIARLIFATIGLILILFGVFYNEKYFVLIGSCFSIASMTLIIFTP
jgi:hypothetical protein